MKPHFKKKPNNNNTTTDTTNSYNNPPNISLSLSTLRETTFARTSMRFHCNEPSSSQSANIRYDLSFSPSPPQSKQTHTQNPKKITKGNQQDNKPTPTTRKNAPKNQPQHQTFTQNFKLLISTPHIIYYSAHNNNNLYPRDKR